METPDILRRKLAGIYTEATVGAVDGRTVFVVRADGADVAELDVGTIVAVTAPQPRLELAEAAARLGLPYAVVGDALAPRQATDAFREGEMAALAL
jgi:hypothetical protein